MFERFTEHARQVVIVAREEARGLGHGWIGTEHILLGLLREDDGGVAARVLRSVDVTAERARTEVVRLVGDPGADPTPRQIPFTPRAKKVLELALREALGLGHNYIGPEHILLGLVSEDEGIAARVLLDFGADAEKVRDEVVAVLSGPAAGVAAAGPRLIPRRRARRLVHDALRRLDVEAESTLGTEAWEAMVEEILDANPDVEPAGP